MQNLIESAATKAGVPSEVLDLIGRDYISQLVEDLPSLLLPPIMGTLKREFVKNGLEWMEQNLSSLQNHFLLLRQMYGATGPDEFQKPEYSLFVP